MPTQIPNIKEKIGAAVAYLTLGIWGFVIYSMFISYEVVPRY